MFLRCKVRRKDGKQHRYWSVVENSRVTGGRVVQRHVLYLGEINDTQELAWRRSIEVLEDGAARPRTLSLFPEDRVEGLLTDASVVGVRLSELRLRRPRQWGACWLALLLWRELQLDQFWSKRLEVSRKGTHWDEVLFVLVAYRLLAPGSEWRLHREWFQRSALADLLGEDAGLAEIHKLYRCHDGLLYDLTSTYFEADPPFPEGDKRRFGYSRDHRPDCVQIIIALVVTPEGLPLAYEVLPGNTAGQDDVAAISRAYRAAIRQGAPGLADGPRRADRRGARRNARGRPGGALPGGHAEGPLGAFGEASGRPAMARGATRSAGQTVGAGGRALRLGPKPRPRRQRACDAAAAAEAVVGAAQATLHHAAHARGTADETRRRARSVAQRLAPGRDRGRRRQRHVQLSARSQ